MVFHAEGTYMQTKNLLDTEQMHIIIISRLVDTCVNTTEQEAQ